MYIFDLNAPFPLTTLRIVATHSMQKDEPRLLPLKKKKGCIAVCRGKEWSILVAGNSVIREDAQGKKSCPFTDEDLPAFIPSPPSTADSDTKVMEIPRKEITSSTPEPLPPASEQPVADLMGTKIIEEDETA